MTRSRSFKRGLAATQRTSPELRASLHDRLSPAGRRELAELGRRIRDLLDANAKGDLSAADVVGCLYEGGWDE